jgi:EAL and modified HD-GYP domain-containing signal transduction protein
MRKDRNKNKYIVRQPIRNAQKQTIGYEILYHGENQAFGGLMNDKEFAAADTVYNFLIQNTDKILKGSFYFMTFTATLLLKKTPDLFDRSELVIQIDDSVMIHPAALAAVHEYAAKGYRIAVNEFQFLPRYLALLDTIDYLKLNFSTTSEEKLKNIIEIAHSLKKLCIATNVDTEELYARAEELGVDAMEGTRVAEKLATKIHNSGYLQSNFFRLIVAMSREEPEIGEVEELISVDATLSYALLRLANSCYFARRNRATTVRQAIMTVGLNQLRQWVYLLSANNAENEMDRDAEEFLKLSLLRGTFCSKLMKYATGMTISGSDAYLMGMFSTLHYLIDAPMEEILEEIPVPEDVKAALLHREGRAGQLFELALCYERADWNGVAAATEALGIPANLLTGTYFACVDDVNSIWTQVTNPRPEDA